MRSSIKRLGSAMHSVADTIGTLGLIGAALTLAGLIAAYLIEVFFRYWLNDPTGWANDVVSYLLALSVFLAMPKVAQQGGHVAITFLMDALPPRLLRPALFVIGLTTGVVCLWVGVVVGLETHRQFERGLTTMARYPISKWWISSVIAFGFLGSAWHFLGQAIHPIGRPAEGRK